jgi:hypothetical protein
VYELEYWSGTVLNVATRHDRDLHDVSCKVLLGAAWPRLGVASANYIGIRIYTTYDLLYNLAVREAIRHVAR